MNAESLKVGDSICHHGIEHRVMRIQMQGSQVQVRCEARINGFPVNLSYALGESVTMAREAPSEPLEGQEGLAGHDWPIDWGIALASLLGLFLLIALIVTDSTRHV